MDTELTPQQHKQAIAKLFSRVADGYDSPALRFFPFCADKLVSKVAPRPGQKVLDVATGTGVVAISMAQALLPGGRVVAIDLSEKMLDRTAFHARKMGLENIDIFDMDGAILDFKRDYFDTIACSYGLFFMPDIDAALLEWKRVCKPGGKIIFTSFDVKAFVPLRDLFLDDLERLGAKLPEGRTFMADQLNSAERCSDALDRNGFEKIQIDNEQLGYHLSSADDWWEIIWNSGYRALIDLLPSDQLGNFKVKHLREVDKLVTEKGIWLPVDTLFSQAIKPA